MKKILAIALLTVRDLARSRVFAIAAAAIVVFIAGLPLVIRGDGTRASEAAIFASYSSGLLLFVVSLVATWLGAGAISLDASTRRIHLVVTKPVRALQVWTGKLLGLTVVNLALIAVGWILICGLLSWMLKPLRASDTVPAESRVSISTVYEAFAPAPGAPGVPGQAAVSPGAAYTWRFDMKSLASPGAGRILDYRIVPSPFSYQSPVAGLWRIVADGGPAVIVQKSSSPNMVSSLALPDVPTGRSIVVEYVNLQTNPAVTVFFPQDSSMRLLIPRGGFSANLLRGAVMIFARAMLFTCLGMLAGTLFSFPVAVIVSMAALALAFSGDAIRSIAENGIWAGVPREYMSFPALFLDGMARNTFRLVQAIFPPIETYDPLVFLRDNLFIQWELAGESLLVLGAAYAAAAVILGAACLGRREIGAASQS